MVSVNTDAGKNITIIGVGVPPDGRDGVDVKGKGLQSVTIENVYPEH